MEEDKLIESMIIDDFTPLTHALERIKGQGNQEENAERGSRYGLHT